MKTKFADLMVVHRADASVGRQSVMRTAAQSCAILVKPGFLWSIWGCPHYRP
jgi:hypothetical protein